MTGSPWFKCYPSNFLNGVADLSPNELAVYTVCLMRMYDEGGPIEDNEGRIGRRCNMRPTTCRKAIDSLVLAEKMSRRDGMLSNDRAQKEIEIRSKVSEKSAQSANIRWSKVTEKDNKNNDPPMRTHKKEDADAMLLEDRSQKIERKPPSPPLEENQLTEEERELLDLPDSCDRRGKQEVKAEPKPGVESLNDDEMRQWAAEHAPGVDLDFELGKYRDWLLDKGKRTKDHRARFRNWMRKAYEMLCERNGGNGQAPPGEPPPKMGAWWDGYQEARKNGDDEIANAIVAMADDGDVAKANARAEKYMNERETA